MYFLAPSICRSNVVTIDAAEQPHACATPALLVGVHGPYPQNDLQRAFDTRGSSAPQGNMVKMQVRPNTDPVSARDYSHGLGGMPHFDVSVARKAVKSMLGEVWLTVARGLEEREGRRFVLPKNFNPNDPYEFQIRFPRAAEGIFELLPELEFMTAYVKNGSHVNRVALVPMTKLESIAEWGEQKPLSARIKVRGILNGKSADILLPKATFTVPKALQDLAGSTRHERGQHPLRIKHASVALAKVAS